MNDGLILMLSNEAFKKKSNKVRNKNFLSSDKPVIFSDELEEALKDSFIMEEEIKKGKIKGYHNINKLFEDLDNEY
jgi:hypothetical protein